MDPKHSVLMGMHCISLVQINKNFLRKNVNIFLPNSFNLCFGCSKEPSHLDGSFEYPQYVLVEK